MIDFVKVGKKITFNRKKLNLTQDDLADNLYVTRQLVSKWENGIGVPSIDDLIAMAKIFKISIDDLLCLDEEIDVDENDIFKGQNRLFIIESIINNKISVNLANIFYQLSPLERMMVLKAVNEGKITTDLNELIPRLTPNEVKYLNKGEQKWF